MTASKMACIEIAEPGGPEGMRLAERPIPEPGAGEVLIKVAAAGINGPDLMQRKGLYPPPPGASDILGLEVAGTVAALGPDASDLKEGDTVCALVTGGGYAEFCTAAAPLCLPIPAGFDMIRAGGTPECWFTVWSNLVDTGGLAEGMRVLIHGGSSGIGLAGIQLAKAFGAEVFTTAGSDEKCAACREHGANHAINYRDTDFAEVIKAETGGMGVNLILDMVGGDYFPRNIRSMAPDAKLLSIGFARGPKAEVNFAQVMVKRLTLTGSTLRPRPLAQKAAIAMALRDRVWPLFEKGAARTTVDSSYPLGEAADAHRRMESSQHIGKVVLAV